MKYKKCFLHVDMDAFFASVEQLDHPDWKGKPVIVGGLPGQPRSVVSTASYEARKYGVHSAMPTVQAVKLCPDGIYTHGNYKRYSEISCKIMDILKKYSPDVNQLSIDEASVDITGTEMLFGPPDELALKIQKEIFDTTGLTVSAGLASTAYLAKLSSEVNKPNGFFAIPEGQEESFMLKLPLKKVWGIGDKTLQRLNKAGFFTTGDIHQKPLTLLQTMLGENLGIFLYNTVRGIETEGPSKPSTHSISNETTFPVDISDIYTAETAIMELCYSVMFRLLKNKSFSKTIVIKIRYEDFTTVSVRQTYEDYVSSTDDMFEKAKQLFEKKYEFGRGIRLLGVGLDNVQDENVPVQELLFDFGEKKRQAVENAILKLSSKHPEIEVKKARMLNTGIKGKITLLLLTAGLFLFSMNKIEAEEFVNEVTETSAAAINPAAMLLPLPVEAPRTLFDYTTDSNQIEFLAQGWWQGNMTGSLTSTYSSENGFSQSSPAFVFQQQVDLSLWFMLNRQWYFETSFADEFTKNTIAAGFFGKPSNPLKEVRIANRGITFPDTYSISLFKRGIGGGDNQAPGFLARFEQPESAKWKADLAMRYDMVQQQDATFYGKNSVSVTSISLSEYITGQFFALPQTSGLADKLTAVYVQSSSGSYTDSSGRKYKKLSSDQYLILEAKNMVVISKDAGIQKKNNSIPAIAFEFSGIQDFSSILGSWNDSQTFLGSVQEVFGKNTSLNKFAYNYTDRIEEKTVLLVQNSKGFSPFIFANYYDTGIIHSAQVILGSSHTQEAAENYSAEITEEFESFLTSSFVNDRHSYAQIFKNNVKSNDFTAPENRYPLADILPGTYLNYSENTDMALLVRTFTPVSNYSIGTTASAGSVRAYKNGVLDSGAKYNKDSGTVELSTSASELDKIFITWNEDSGEAQNGSLAAQGGFSAAITENTTADISTAINWTVSPYAQFAEKHRSAQGYATFAAGITHQKENLLLSNAGSVTYENSNVTGFYRIDGFEDSKSQTYYQGKNAIYLLKDDFVPSLNATQGTYPVLSAENNCTTVSSSQKGISDKNISGYKLPVEWDFSKATQASPWAAINIALDAGGKLANASALRLALQFDKNLLDDCQLYLQLGVQASDDPEKEYTSNTATWLLEDFSQDDYLKTELKEDNWHTATIRLQNFQRSLITSYHDARIIVVGKDSVSEKFKKSVIYAGPYEILSNGIVYSGPENLNLLTEQIKDNSIPLKDRFNTDDNILQKISWDSSVQPEEGTEINAARYFEETDISDYEKLNFLVKSSGCSILKILLDRNSDCLENEGKPAVKAIINSQTVSSLAPDSWHTVSINLKENTIQVDGAELPKDSFSLFIDKKVLATRFRIVISPAARTGEFLLDELHLEGSHSRFILEDIARLKLEKKGVLLQNRNQTIAENALFESQGNASASILDDNSSQSGTLLSTTNAEITVLGVRLAASTMLSSDQKNLLSSGAHSVETKQPVFGLLSFTDSFIFNPADSSSEKLSKASISFNRFKVPLTLSADAADSKNRWAFTNRLSLQEDLNLAFSKFDINLKTSAQANQKLPSFSSKIKEIEDDTYFSSYKSSTEDSFNSGKEEATLRSVQGKASLSSSIKFLHLKPAINYETVGKYTNSASSKFSDSNTISAELPFTVSRQRFTLKYTKNETGLQLTEKGGSYSKDISSLSEALQDRDFYFNTLPIQDLISRELSENIKNKSQKTNMETLSYTGLYSFNWKRPVFADIRDLFIPSSFDFSTQRQIIAATNYSDMYVLKAAIMNTPFNLFGKQSSKKLFNWYNTDEYVISMTGTAKIPADSITDTLWQTGIYAQANYYLNDNDILKTGAQFTMETDYQWSAKATVLYKRKVSDSPVISGTRLVYKKADYSKIRLFRTDSLDAEVTWSPDNSFLTHSYKYSHQLNAEITSVFTVTSGLGAEMSIKKDLASFILSGSLGAKLSF